MVISLVGHEVSWLKSICKTKKPVEKEPVENIPELCWIGP